HHTKDNIPMDYSSQKSKKTTSKTVKRGAPIPIKRTLEDAPLAEFIKAMDILSQVRIGDPRRLTTLKSYRDLILFAAKRANQNYLAGAIIAWSLLGEPTKEHLYEIDIAEYQRITTS